MNCNNFANDSTGNFAQNNTQALEEHALSEILLSQNAVTDSIGNLENNDASLPNNSSVAESGLQRVTVVDDVKTPLTTAASIPKDIDQTIVSRIYHWLRVLALLVILPIIFWFLFNTYTSLLVLISGKSGDVFTMSFLICEIIIFSILCFVLLVKLEFSWLYRRQDLIIVYATLGGEILCIIIRCIMGIGIHHMINRLSLK